MKYAAISDKGLVRAENQDSYYVGEYVVAVADGMGGHEAGGLASRTAVEAVETALGRPPRRPKQAMREAFVQANAAVLQQARQTDQAGMGTTMTIALVDGRRLWLGHVGDSRAYLLRAGRLRQLTEDHSLVADLVKSGSLSPAQAKDHPRRNVITRAVGIQTTISPDVLSVQVEPRDRLILCTDGLTNPVDVADIERLASRVDLESACRTLVEAANRAGGHDNITVVMVEFPGDGPVAQAKGWRRFLSWARPAFACGQG